MSVPIPTEPARAGRGAGPVAVQVTVNGVRHAREVAPRTLLLDFLREDLGLTGAHSGCDDGLCGTCTVLLDGQPVKSCLLLAAQVDGAEVTTVEGLRRGDALHPVQQAFIDEHAVQCGYCTPGFVVAAVALLHRDPEPTDESVRDGLLGNLCRCGSYQNIRRAVLTAARRVAANSARPDGRPVGRS